VNPELGRVAVAQGGVVSRAQAMSAGYTPEQIRERLTDGRWERVRRGQYAERADLGALAPWEQELFRHRRLVHAAMNAMRPGSAVVSHHSALVLHRIPTWRADLAEVQLTRTSGRGEVKAGVRHHQGLLTPVDLTRAEGLAITSVPRAVIETASTTSFEAAVVSADAALRRPEVTVDEFDRLLTVTECWPGSPTIRSALAFADPLSESVGESLLRVLMHNEGLPPPVLQAVFNDHAGFIGRVDFYFPDYNTVVEFDGLLKYADGSRHALIQEKIREDRLSALGLQVLRLTWDDLAHPARTAQRIREMFDRSRRTRLAG
jgi:hypothetical protein